MAKLPSSILKQLTAKAKERTEKIKSTDVDTSETLLIKAHGKTGNYYLMYDNVIKFFLIAGYGEKAAIKYIDLWKDYDMVDEWYLDAYRIVGFNAAEIERMSL